MKLETKEEYLVDSAIEMLYPTVTFNSYEAAVKHIHETPGTWRITKIYRTLPVGEEVTEADFERVCDILSRHGYQISRWTRTEDLETRLKELDEALSSVVPTSTVDRETLYAISCLQQLRTTLGLQDRKEHGR